MSARARPCVAIALALLLRCCCSAGAPGSGGAAASSRRRLASAPPAPDPAPGALPPARPPPLSPPLALYHGWSSPLPGCGAAGGFDTVAPTVDGGAFPLLANDSLPCAAWKVCALPLPAAHI